MEKTTNDKARQGIGILIFVVIFIGLASTSLGKEKKHGPEVVVQKNNEIVRGELLRVKNDEIILMSSLNGSGITLKVDDIQKIKIVKKGHFFRGVGLGIVIGGAGGALLGFASGDVYLYSRRKSANGCLGIWASWSGYRRRHQRNQRHR